MNKFLAALLSLLICFPLFAAEGFSSLEEQMTGKEFSAAGLDKLSQSELDALNHWIRRHSLATLDAASAGPAGSGQAGVDRRGLKSEEKEDRSPITSKIVGNFRGWDGQTMFKLENGMIWAQADKDKFFIKETDEAVAVIEPGMFGTWHLHIEGYGSECRVRRIQ
jgi:hypothetical protein